MSGRISLMVSLLAIGASVACVIILGDKIVVLNRRVAALEQRPVFTAPPSLPPPATPETESPEELKRKEIQKKADEMFREHMDELGKKVGASPELLAKLRTAFAEEFTYYADGVMRTLNDLNNDDEGGEDMWMETPEFRRGMEQRIAATDEKLRGLLTVSQYWSFEEWRKQLRKEPYRLD